jgi:polyhydroxyalkanoate synthesis regulator phasin
MDEWDFQDSLEGGDQSMSVLKNTVLASIGLFEITKARAERIIDDLIQKGELTRSDRKKAVLELLDKAEQSSARFRKKVLTEVDQAQSAISKMAEDLKWARQAEMKKLQSKVSRLTKAVEALQKNTEETKQPIRARKPKKKQ